MRIYVSGPYRGSSEEEVLGNVGRANELGRQLAYRGHTPFVPHTMMEGWEASLGRRVAMRLCLEWLAQCEAILASLGNSEGVDIEIQEAAKLGLPVFRSVDEVPPPHGEVVGQGVE